MNQEAAKTWIKSYGDRHFDNQAIWVEFKEKVIEKEPPIVQQVDASDPISTLLPKTYKKLNNGTKWNDIRTFLNPYLKLPVYHIEYAPRPIEKKDKVSLVDSPLPSISNADIQQQQQQPQQQEEEKDIMHQETAKAWIKSYGDRQFDNQAIWVEFKKQVIEKEPPIVQQVDASDPISTLLPKTYETLNNDLTWKDIRTRLNPYLKLPVYHIEYEPRPIEKKDKVSLVDSPLPFISNADVQVQQQQQRQEETDVAEGKYEQSEEQTILPGFYVSHHAINDLAMFDDLLKTRAVIIDLSTSNATATSGGGGRRVVLNDQSLPSLAIPDMFKPYAKDYAERNGQTWLLFERDWNTLVLALESGKQTEDARVARVLLIGLIAYIVKDAMNDFTTSTLIYGGTDKLSDAVMMAYRN